MTASFLPDKQTLEMLQQENLRLVSLVEGLGQLARADAAHAYLERQTCGSAGLSPGDINPLSDEF